MENDDKHWQRGGAARNDDLAFGGGCAHKRGQEVGPEGYILAADQQIETRAGIGHRGCAEVRPAPRKTGQKKRIFLSGAKAMLKKLQGAIPEDP